MTNPHNAFDEPDQTTGVRINPRDIVGHLLLVWPIDYIAHSPTVHTRADRPSDVIVVDCVDLDAYDENGGIGLLARRVWWRQSKLIQALRSKVGSPRPILTRMTLGVAAKGFQAPFELQSASGDPQAVQRGQAWLAAHPEFDASVPPAPVSPAEVPVQDPWQPEQRQQSLLEQMAHRSAQALPKYNPPPAQAPYPPQPPRPPQPDQPGF